MMPVSVLLPQVYVHFSFKEKGRFAKYSPNKLLVTTAHSMLCMCVAFSGSKTEEAELFSWDAENAGIQQNDAAEDTNVQSFQCR